MSTARIDGGRAQVMLPAHTTVARSVSATHAQFTHLGRSKFSLTAFLLQPAKKIFATTLNERVCVIRWPPIDFLIFQAEIAPP